MSRPLAVPLTSGDVPPAPVESYGWIAEALDAVEFLGRSLTPELQAGDRREEIFFAACPALLRVVDFASMGFLLFGDDGLDVAHRYFDPPDRADEIRAEIETQVRDGTFAWALNQNRLVVVPSASKDKWLVLQVLATPSRVLGMFVGTLNGESSFVPELSQRILSVLLQSCAGFLETRLLQARLQDHNQNLETLIEIRTRELRHSENEARAAVRAKSEFLASMSHEIRTPMNGVVGMLDLLLDSGMDEGNRTFARTARQSAEILMKVINDILDHSKIEAGRVQLEAISFDLRRQLDDVVAAIAPEAHRRGLELFVHYTGSVPKLVRGDPSRLRQILLNLVGNAIKFTERGGVVVRATSEVRDGATWFGLAIEDTGVGIPADKVEKIFDQFTQADASTTRRYGGTGLGLSISRGLVTLMGGDIEVTTEVGVGSTFMVVLPLEVESQDQAVGLLKDRNFVVVSRSPQLVRAFVDIASPYGASVTPIMDPGKVQALLTQPETAESTDLILFDEALRPLGEDLARALASVPITEGIPCGVIMSIAAPPESRQESVFDAVLCKPFVDDGGRRLLQLLEDEKASPVEIEAVSAPSNDTLGTVLVVEDEAVNRLVVTEMLERLGWSVDLAEGGEAALDALDVDKYAAVLMDCQMPNMDGFETTRRILSRWAGMAPPVIALTAHAMAGDRDRCLSAGMVDYLTKPVSQEALRKALERWGAERSQPDSAGEGAPGHPPPRGGHAKAVAPGTAQDVIDLAAARRHTGGNARLLAEIVWIFLDSWPRSRAELHAAMENEDARGFGVVAHRLRGTAGTIGASTVWEIASHLEDEANRGAVDRAGLKRLDEAVAEVVQFVSDAPELRVGASA